MKRREPVAFRCGFVPAYSQTRSAFFRQNEIMFGESLAEAWSKRFGEEHQGGAEAISQFLTHRSIREYSGSEISRDTIELLIGAAESASSSSNLQLWSVVSVQKPERREEMAKLCGDQDHVRKAPWFLCFLADHYRLRKAAESKGEQAAGLDYAEFALMAAIDASLAAERLVCAAESMGIGVCYIGALRNNPPGVHKLLNLPHGTFGLFGLCLGYPAEDCHAEIKPRMLPGSVWFDETYNLEANCDEYDQRMRPFYESQGMKGSVTWSMRSARRVDGSHMTGREVLKEFLESQGFYRR